VAGRCPALFSGILVRADRTKSAAPPQKYFGLVISNLRCVWATSCSFALQSGEEPSVKMSCHHVDRRSAASAPDLLGRNRSAVCGCEGLLEAGIPPPCRRGVEGRSAAGDSDSGLAGHGQRGGRSFVRPISRPAAARFTTSASAGARVPGGPEPFENYLSKPLIPTVRQSLLAGSAGSADRWGRRGRRIAQRMPEDCTPADLPSRAQIPRGPWKTRHWLGPEHRIHA